MSKEFSCSRGWGLKVASTQAFSLALKKKEYLSMSVWKNFIELGVVYSQCLGRKMDKSML